MKRRFDRSWDEVATGVGAIPANAGAPATARRPMPEMVEETVTIVRSLEKAMARAVPRTATVTRQRVRSTAAGIEKFMSEQEIKGHVKVVDHPSVRGTTPAIEIRTYGVSDDENAKVRDIVDALHPGMNVTLGEDPFWQLGCGVLQRPSRAFSQAVRRALIGISGRSDGGASRRRNLSRRPPEPHLSQVNSAFNP